MKSLAKVFTIIVLCSIATFSCDQESGISSIDRLPSLTKETLSSSQFLNLNVPLSQLNVKASQYVNTEENSIFIPFNGHDDRKGVIAIFNKMSIPIAVSEYEVITSISADQVFSQLKKGNFNGTFVVRLETGEMQLKMENSKIISKNVRTAAGGRMLVCNGFTQPGGALDCAGQRLENMNWLEQARCFSTFIPCMVELVLSCMIDKCEP
jgi:hypothetical protein